MYASPELSILLIRVWRQMWKHVAAGQTDRKETYYPLLFKTRRSLPMYLRTFSTDFYKMMAWWITVLVIYFLVTFFVEIVSNI